MRFDENRFTCTSAEKKTKTLKDFKFRFLLVVFNDIMAVMGLTGIEKPQDPELLHQISVV